VTLAGYVATARRKFGPMERVDVDHHRTSDQRAERRHRIL
jgi:hypothetical protein